MSLFNTKSSFLQRSPLYHQRLFLQRSSLFCSVCSLSTLYLGGMLCFLSVFSVSLGGFLSDFGMDKWDKCGSKNFFLNSETGNIRILKIFNTLFILYCNKIFEFFIYTFYFLMKVI